jgi:anthranilate 1,2-dioxygenase small subunit
MNAPLNPAVIPVEAAAAVQPGDLSAIHTLLTRYCDALDEERFDDWPDFFTEDAQYRLTTAENLRKGYPVGLIDCMGKPMMRDRLFGLKAANVFEPHTYRHILSQPLVSCAGESQWQVKTSFLLARTMAAQDAQLFLCGHYRDLVVRTDTGLLLKSREVVLDASLIDLLIVIPV